MSETSNTSSKVGDLKKCPACGALVSPLDAKCPECGHEFSNVEANVTSAKLLETLEQIDIQCAQLPDGKELSVKRKIQTIKNFPIPNTKGDIIEMLTLCHANAVESGGEPKLRDAWSAKSTQIISKAQIVLKDDKDTMALIAKIQGAKAKNKKKKRILIISIVAAALAVIAGIIVFKSISDQKDFEETSKFADYQTQVTKAIQQNDVVAAYDIIGQMNEEITRQGKQDEYEELMGGSYLKLVMALLKDDYLQDAATVGLEYRDNLKNDKKWRESQILKLLVDECEAQDYDTDILY